MTDQTQASAGGDITVDLLADDDDATRERLGEIARHAFPTPQHHFVTFPPHTLVARADGEVVGAVAFKLLEGEPPVAVTAWALVDPTAQARGIGDRLVEAGLAHLRDHGCRATVASIRWSNTPSSKIAARHGYERISSTTLLRRVGLARGMALLANSFHPVNLSCGLWYRPLDPDGGESTTEAGSVTDSTTTSGEQASQTRSTWLSASGFAAMLAVHVLLAAVAIGGVGVSTWDWATLGIGAVVAGLLVLRWLPFAVMAALDSARWTFWGWGNVYPLAGGIAAFGGVLPVPGHIAGAQPDWSYWRRLGVLGPAAAASAALLVGALVGSTLARGRLGSEWTSVRTLLTVFVVVDLWLVVWPFEGYNGRVVYDWNRLVWAGIAVLGAVAVAGAYLV